MLKYWIKPIADYKQLNQWSKWTRIPFRTEYYTLISFVHFKFEMCRHRSRCDILWIIIWLISGPTMNVSLVLGNSLIWHWQPGGLALPSWLGVLRRCSSARYYMRGASVGQAKFWRKGFNVGPKPLYLGSISDTILDISIVFCFCFCCWYWQW